MKLACGLVLASASPRRREILATLGLEFEVVNAAIDETPATNESAAALVVRLAHGKAERAASLRKDDVAVLGADTVVCVEGKILGKPRDRSDALRMLELLSGRVHEVVTGFSIMRRALGVRAHGFDTTKVWMREANRGELERYVASGEPDDKAGAYAVQGLASGLITRIDGSYANVVGLPAHAVLDAFVRSGIVTEWP